MQCYDIAHAWGSASYTQRRHESEHRADLHRVVSVTRMTAIGGNALLPEQLSVGSAAVRADEPLRVRVALEPAQTFIVVQRLRDG